MSKQHDVVDVQPEDLPPPYTPTNPSVQEVSSLLSSHLRSLPSRISSAQAARKSERDQRDGEILAILAPHIEDMIHAIAAREPPPSQVEMAMIPEDAVGDGWSFSDENRVRTVVKVREPSSKTKGDSKQSQLASTPREQAFDEWGRWEDEASAPPRESLWWSDDEMASRLAKYLQPDRPRPTRPPPASVAEPTRQAKKSPWGLFRKNTEPVATPLPPPPPAPQVQEEPVSMTVRAEEVTFRKENEMGIWESKTGWGLVVRIRVRQ